MTADHDALRARAESATPGPWEVLPTRTGAYVTTDPRFSGGRLGDFDMIADAEFAAHARTDIPALLADRDALAAEVERLTWENAERRRDSELAVTQAAQYSAWLAAARARVAGLEAEVEQLQGDDYEAGPHRPFEADGFRAPELIGTCIECGYPWPCPAIAATGATS